MLINKLNKKFEIVIKRSVGLGWVAGVVVAFTTNVETFETFET